ncbi:MAG: CPBP family intramembrane glutamic endopeptidase [Spartobacteria bacterium]
MKDALRLLVYFAAVLLVGALLAPVLFWSAQPLVGMVPALAKVDFESFFHRALLVAALALLWPLLRAVRVRSIADLNLEKNPAWLRHGTLGFLFAAIPLLCCGAAAIAFHVYSLRGTVDFAKILQVIGAAAVVPFLEEAFFRGLLLGVLLRSGQKYMSILITSAFFSIIHFLKAPEQTSTIVTWTSGFHSIANSLAQFTDPMLVAASFTTLFLLGWILGDARVRTRSLWMPIGLHAGWILSAGVFNKIARRQMLALPWLGKSLLVGLAPLLVALITWLLVLVWLKYERTRNY